MLGTRFSVLSLEKANNVAFAHCVFLVTSCEFNYTYAFGSALLPHQLCSCFLSGWAVPRIRILRLSACCRVCILPHFGPVVRMAMDGASTALRSTAIAVRGSGYCFLKCSVALLFFVFAFCLGVSDDSSWSCYFFSYPSPPPFRRSRLLFGLLQFVSFASCSLSSFISFLPSLHRSCVF